MNVAKQEQTQKHIADQVCCCHYCTTLDIIFGDPLMTPWEQKFVNNVIHRGWLCDYSPKQKAVINKIYTKLYTKRS